MKQIITKAVLIVLCLFLLANFVQAQNKDIIKNPAPGIFVDLLGRDCGGRTCVNDFKDLTIVIILALLQIAGLLAILFLIIGGFQYITSGANQELAEIGKKTVTNAIIGLVIIVLSYVIVIVIINALNP